MLILYFLTGWFRKPVRSTALNTSAKPLPFVSIIIPVRNEAENIRECLASVFAQNYPSNLFEVIVINDYSIDTTLKMALESPRANLKVLNLFDYYGEANERVPNKKKAITLGIKNAAGEIIITTDGDCTTGPNWLRAMVSHHLENSHKLITAPVFLSPAKGFFGLFQQMDVMSLAGITAGTIAHGFLTMCNGANLLYEKKTFAEVEGFKGNLDVPTGDDIFLMQKIDGRYPGATAFLKNRDAIAYSKPEKSIGSFFSQRIRWTSKSTQFKRKSVTAILVFAWFYNVAVLVALVYALLPKPLAWLPFSILFGAKLLLDLAFNIGVAHFFRRKIVLLLIPFFELLHIVYVVLIGLLSLRGKYRWKDRKI